MVIFHGYVKLPQGTHGFPNTRFGFSSWGACPEPLADGVDGRFFRLVRYTDWLDDGNHGDTMGIYTGYISTGYISTDSLGIYVFFNHG